MVQELKLSLQYFHYGNAVNEEESFNISLLNGQQMYEESAEDAYQMIKIEIKELKKVRKGWKKENE